MGRGRRIRRSRAARLITSLYPDLNPALLVVRPWSVLQYPIALVMACTEMAGVSTSLIQIPSDGTSMEYGALRFGYQIGRPIILLISGHFAGVVACAPSRTLPPMEAGCGALASPPRRPHPRPRWPSVPPIDAPPVIPVEWGWALLPGPPETVTPLWGRVGDVAACALRFA